MHIPNAETEIPGMRRPYRVFESVLLETYRPWMQWGEYAVPKDELKIQVQALPLTTYAALSQIFEFTGTRMPEHYVGGCLLRTGLPLIGDVFELSLASVKSQREAAGKPDFRFVGPSLYDSNIRLLEEVLVPGRAGNIDLFCLDYCDFTSLTDMSHTYDLSMSTLAILTSIAGMALSTRLVAASIGEWAADCIYGLMRTLSDIDTSAV